MPKLNPEDQELYDAHLESLLEEFPEADGALVIFDDDEYDPVRKARRNLPPPDPNQRFYDPETGMELPTEAELRALQEVVDRGADLDEGRTETE